MPSRWIWVFINLENPLGENSLGAVVAPRKPPKGKKEKKRRGSSRKGKFSVIPSRELHTTKKKYMYTNVKVKNRRSEDGCGRFLTSDPWERINYDKKNARSHRTIFPLSHQFPRSSFPCPGVSYPGSVPQVTKTYTNPRLRETPPNV